MEILTNKRDGKTYVQPKEKQMLIHKRETKTYTQKRKKHSDTKDYSFSSKKYEHVTSRFQKISNFFILKRKRTLTFDK